MIKKAIEKYKKMPIVAKAAIWFVFCNMLQRCISFITVPIFTRIMPTEEYGIYSTYLSCYSILVIICTMNIQYGIYSNVLAKENDEKKKDENAISMLSLIGSITLILFVLYLVFHSIINKIIGLPTALVTLMFAQILFEPPLSLWTTKQRFEFKYIKMVIRTIIMAICNAVLGIVFVILSSKNQALARVVSIVLVQMVFGIAFYIYFFKRTKKIFLFKDWKHYLSVQLPLIPHNLSLTILSSSDRIMINKLIGKVQTAIYSVAYSAGYVVNLLKNSIVDALRPWIYAKIKEKDYDSISRSVNTIIILVSLISIVYSAFAPEIIYILAPKQYYEAIYVIPPVAASSFFTFLFNIFSIVGFYYEKTKRVMVASVSGAILNIVLNLICIPIFGYIAAAYTTLICYMFFSFAHYLIMRSICKQYLENVKIYNMKFISVVAMIVLLVTILFSFTYSNIFFRYGIIVTVMIITFVKRKTFINTLKQLKNEK